MFSTVNHQTFLVCKHSLCPEFDRLIFVDYAAWTSPGPIYPPNACNTSAKLFLDASSNWISVDNATASPTIVMNEFFSSPFTPLSFTCRYSRPSSSCTSFTHAGYQWFGINHRPINCFPSSTFPSALASLRIALLFVNVLCLDVRPLRMIINTPARFVLGLWSCYRLSPAWTSSALSRSFLCNKFGMNFTEEFIWISFPSPLSLGQRPAFNVHRSGVYVRDCNCFMSDQRTIRSFLFSCDMNMSCFKTMW